jgi:GT2 family glycosyltransferase
MDVSIIILNYKSKGLVRQCVKTIRLCAPKTSYEVIVVDNDSGDGVGAMLASQYPEVRFIQSPKNVGYAAGNNLGLRAARGRYLVIMNPDITMRPGSLDAMVAFMDSHADVGIMGPKLVHPDESIDVSCYRFPGYAIPIYRRTPLGKLPAGRRAVSRYLMSEYDRKGDRDVDWLLGAVLMVRRSAIEKVGLLDERYFLYFEDTDWCRRFWQAGWRVVYFTGAKMVHYHERLSAQGSWLVSPFRKSTRIHISSCIKYFMKWGTAVSENESEKA